MSFATDLGSFSTLKKIIKLLAIGYIGLLFTGCAGFRYLKEDEKLLYKQKINSGNVFDNYTIEQLFVQEANVKFPPYGPMYMWGVNRYDTARYLNKQTKILEKYKNKTDSTMSQRKLNRLASKRQKKLDKVSDKLTNGNLLMQWGEPLSIFDSTLVEQTTKNISQFFFNKGYFNNRVSYQVNISRRNNKKVVVVYTINEGIPYRLDSIFVRTKDTNIEKLLLDDRKNSKLVKGDVFDQDLLSKERERLEYFLKDNGYYDFSRQFIRFDLDTLSRNNPNSVDIRIRINQPTNKQHKQFRIDSINFVINPNYDHSRFNDRIPKKREGIRFLVYEDIFSTKMLARRTFIEKDSLYSRTSTLKTQRQLANLDNFKFININYDSSGGDFIANIFTQPLDRYQWSHELGADNKYGTFGPFYNVSFKKRNIFRGLENFEVNGRIRSDIKSTSEDENDLKNTEISLSTGLNFPQFIAPLSYRFKNRFGSQNPMTRIQASYTLTNRVEAYRRKNYNLSANYTWQNEKNAFYNFSLLDVSIIDSELEPEFKTTLDKLNARLANSFNSSYVSSTHFTVQKTVINPDKLPSERTSFYRIFTEIGGVHLYAMPDSFPKFTDNPLTKYKFLKVELDYSNSKPLSSVSSIAFRFNGGLATPYGSSTSLPYEKYFFAGGSNGIRAWRPRRLGPGSYVNYETTQEGDQLANYDLEQQGEILIQASAEFRRHLIGFIEYALFVDAGNIWLINDEVREKNFELGKFYKEIAVGTGLGLRFDFSFLIFRFDTGVRTHDPARPQGSRWIFQDGFFNDEFISDPGYKNLLAFNIGVGYPF